MPRQPAEPRSSRAGESDRRRRTNPSAAVPFPPGDPTPMASSSTPSCPDLGGVERPDGLPPLPGGDRRGGGRRRALPAPGRPADHGRRETSPAWPGLGVCCYAACAAVSSATCWRSWATSARCRSRRRRCRAARTASRQGSQYSGGRPTGPAGAGWSHFLQVMCFMRTSSRSCAACGRNWPRGRSPTHGWLMLRRSARTGRPAQADRKIVRLWQDRVRGRAKVPTDGHREVPTDGQVGPRPSLVVSIVS